MDTGISACVGRYERREITLEQFLRESRPYWVRMAERLRRRWLFHYLETDDIVQTMLAEVVFRLPKWDASKASLEKYIVWNAQIKAKRMIHTMRGAKKSWNRGKERSRHHMPLDVIGLEILNANRAPLDALLAWDAAKARAPKKWLPIFRALERAHGHIEEACVELDADVSFRLANRIGSDADMRRTIKSVLDFVESVLG